MLSSSNQQETLYVSPLHVLPAQGAAPSPVSTCWRVKFFPPPLPSPPPNEGPPPTRTQIILPPFLLPFPQNQPLSTRCLTNVPTSTPKPSVPLLRLTVS